MSYIKLQRHDIIQVEKGMKIMVNIPKKFIFPDSPFQLKLLNMKYY